MVDIVFQRDKNRAAAFDGDTEIGEITFSDRGGVWVIDHTMVQSAYGGQGIARLLVDAVVEEAAKEGISLDATCSYVVRVFREEKYRDMLV